MSKRSWMFDLYSGYLSYSRSSIEVGLVLHMACELTGGNQTTSEVFVDMNTSLCMKSHLERVGGRESGRERVGE